MAETSALYDFTKVQDRIWNSTETKKSSPCKKV